MPMLCVYISLILFLGYDVAGAPTKENDDFDIYKWVEDLIKQRCMKNANQNTTDEALAALCQFNGQWQLFLPHDQTINGDELYHYCIENTENFATYLQTFLEKLTPCLDFEERYLTQFLIDSYGSYNHFFCKFISVTDTGKENKEKCLKKFEVDPRSNPRIACHENSKIFSSNDTAISRELICNEISDVEPCYKKILDEQCADSQETKDFTLILLTQALGICLQKH